MCTIQTGELSSLLQSLQTLLPGLQQPPTPLSPKTFMTHHKMGKLWGTLFQPRVTGQTNKIPQYTALGRKLHTALCEYSSNRSIVHITTKLPPYLYASVVPAGGVHIILLFESTSKVWQWQWIEMQWSVLDDNYGWSVTPGTVLEGVLCPNHMLYLLKAWCLPDHPQLYTNENKQPPLQSMCWDGTLDRSFCIPPSVAAGDTFAQQLYTNHQLWSVSDPGCVWSVFV